MNVTIDGNRFDGIAPSDGVTLQGLIDAARTHIGPDRIVISVALDGQLLEGPDLANRLSCPIEDANEVDLGSAGRGEVAAEALRAVADGLNCVAGEQEGVADLIHAGKLAEAVEKFNAMLEIWRACGAAVEQCGTMLGRDLSKCEYEGRAVEEYLADLASKLRELRDAFEARDTVLLADLIQYEMPETCTLWHDILLHMAESAAEPDAALKA